MEPTKITSTADLELADAAHATKSIESLIEGLGSLEPENSDGIMIRLRTIAGWLEVLTAKLKITSPALTPGKMIEELQASIKRHRETERRHRDQRAQISDLLETHWDQVEHRVRELIEDRRYAIDLFGAVRAMAAAAGLDPNLRPIDMVAQLAEERRGIHLAVCTTGCDPVASLAGSVRAIIEERGMASAPPPDHSGRLIAIHEALNASGITPVGADPLNPIDSVKRLIEERNELLEEMARGAPPEAVAVAASELTDQAERGEDVPWTAASEPPPDLPLGPLCESCREKLCSRCNRCHSVAGFMRGCEFADPPCDHELAPVDVLPGALRIAHEALISVMATSERDWTRAADLAWIYGVLVGWSPDDLEEMQIRFGWREQTVQLIEEHRGALVCAGMAEGA